MCHLCVPTMRSAIATTDAMANNAINVRHERSDQRSLMLCVCCVRCEYTIIRFPKNSNKKRDSAQQGTKAPYNTTQQNTTPQHTTSQHNAPPHDRQQRNAAHHNKTQRRTTHHHATQHNITTRHNTAQQWHHNTAWHKHIATQHNSTLEILVQHGGWR